MITLLRPCPEHRGRGHACTQPSGHGGLHTAAGITWHVFSPEELAARAASNMFDPDRPIPADAAEEAAL